MPRKSWRLLHPLCAGASCTIIRAAERNCSSNGKWQRRPGRLAAAVCGLLMPTCPGVGVDSVEGAGSPIEFQALLAGYGQRLRRLAQLPGDLQRAERLARDGLGGDGRATCAVALHHDRGGDPGCRVEKSANVAAVARSGTCIRGVAGGCRTAIISDSSGAGGALNTIYGSEAVCGPASALNTGVAGQGGKMLLPAVQPASAAGGRRDSSHLI